MDFSASLIVVVEVVDVVGEQDITLWQQSDHITLNCANLIFNFSIMTIFSSLEENREGAALQTLRGLGGKT